MVATKNGFSENENERYVFREKLLAGSYGEIWVGYDQVLEQTVAIKRIHKWISSQPLALKAVQAEVAAGRRISSPHVLKIYDLVRIKSQDCLVMEYVDGLTLNRFVAQQSPTETAIREIASRLCEGLSAMHEAGLAHRDLTPQNVLVENSGRVVIVDLGLAGAIGKDKPRNGRQFYAPELTPCLALADIYSLGRLLAVLGGDFGEDPAHLPHPWLRPIIAKCCLESPSDRYSTAKAVLADLSNSASSQSGPKRTRTVAFGAGAMLLLLCTLGLGMSNRTSPWKNIQYIVFPASSDGYSRMLADTIACYLESEHAAVSHSAHWVDVATNAKILSTPPPNQIVVGATNVVNRIRLTMRSSTGSVQDLVLPVEGRIVHETLSRVATKFHLKAPNDRWDVDRDGYWADTFASDWKVVADGGMLSDNSCLPARSVPVILLRASSSVRRYSAEKSEASHSCATSRAEQIRLAATDSTQGSIIQANLLSIEGNMAESVRMLQLASERLSTKSPIFRALSETALRGGFGPQAITYARRAMEEDPWKAENYASAGKALMTGDKEEPAETALQEGLSLDPRSSSLLTTLGGLYIRTGEFEKARIVLERAIEVQSQPSTNLTLGLANILCGRTSQGMLILSGVAAQSPSLRSLATLGAAYRWIGNTKESWQALTSALALGNLNSTNAIELGQLALVYAQLSQIHQADSMLLRAAQNRSTLESELVYDWMIVDALAERREACLRKYTLLKERRFALGMIRRDPQVAKVLGKELT